MDFKVLPKVLGLEGGSFYRVDRRWKPQNLLPEPYRRDLLKDAQKRFELLSQAEVEFKVLDRSSRYIQLLRRMRLVIKDAQFAWRSDDLRFLVAISAFFQDYGTILRFLKEDHARGQLSTTDPAPSEPV